MKGSAAAILAVLLMGCTSSAPLGTATNRPPSPSSAGPSPLPSATPIDLPLSVVNFTCRLPVARSSTFGDYAAYTGGFVSFPAATFKADPAGGIHSRYLQQDFATDAKPVLYGGPQGGTPFYDLARRRWVPASAAQASPDGAFYAYASFSTSSAQPAHIHVVDVARGTEKVFAVSVPMVGAAARLLVADFDGSGVLFVVVSQPEQQYPNGVWRLDVATGSVRPLVQGNQVLMVRGGYAWVGRVDPRDPSPPRFAGPGLLFDSIVRVDLAGGAEVMWYYQPGKAVWLSGLDSSGNPIVSVATEPPSAIDTRELRVIDTPGGTGTVVFGGGSWQSQAKADHGRLWFGNDRGIYLYTPTTGFQKVFAFKGDPNLAQSILPAGDCR